MTCANIFELCDHVAEKIAAQIGGRVSSSSQSPSRYVEAFVEFEDGDIYDSESFRLRISDHEARSYNRGNDYAITVGAAMQGDAHQFLRAVWMENGEETSRPGDDAELHYDQNDVEMTIAEAVSAFRLFEAKFIADAKMQSACELTPSF